MNKSIFIIIIVPADLSMHDDKNNNNLLQKIDIKGAITLSVTIISFLMALSYLENIHSLTMSDFMPTVILSIVSIVSLTLFIIVERKISAKVKEQKKYQHPHHLHRLHRWPHQTLH